MKISAIMTYYINRPDLPYKNPLEFKPIVTPTTQCFIQRL